MLRKVGGCFALNDNAVVTILAIKHMDSPDNYRTEYLTSGRCENQEIVQFCTLQRNQNGYNDETKHKTSTCSWWRGVGLF